MREPVAFEKLAWTVTLARPLLNFASLETERRRYRTEQLVERLEVYRLAARRTRWTTKQRKPSQ